MYRCFDAYGAVFFTDGQAQLRTCTTLILEVKSHVPPAGSAVHLPLSQGVELNSMPLQEQVLHRP
jgi:hypothetical protein